MKIKISVQALEKALSQKVGIATKNSSLPILASVRIEAFEGHIVIRTTNLHVGVETKLSAIVESKGVCVLDATTLHQAVARMQKNETVTLELEKDVCVMTTTKTTLRVTTQADDDFPTLPTVTSDTAYLLPVQPFLTGLKSVLFAASRNDLRPEIASVGIYGETDTFVFVATDSFRLAEKRLTLKGVDDFPMVLIPANQVSLIVKLLSGYDDNEMVSVKISEHLISFTIKDMYCSARLVDGDFPDYRSIIPRTYATEVIALKEDVVRVMKITQLFSDTLHKLTLAIDPEKQTCVCSSKNNDTGEQSTQLDSSLSGDAITLVVNHAYISEGLQSITTDSVFIGLSEKTPIIMRGVGDTSFTYLVMPMQL